MECNNNMIILIIYISRIGGWPGSTDRRIVAFAMVLQVGKMMAEFPLDPQNSKMVVAAPEFRWLPHGGSRPALLTPLTSPLPTGHTKCRAGVVCHGHAVESADAQAHTHTRTQTHLCTHTHTHPHIQEERGGERQRESNPGETHPATCTSIPPLTLPIHPFRYPHTHTQECNSAAPGTTASSVTLCVCACLYVCICGYLWQERLGMVGSRWEERDFQTRI